MQGGNGLQQSLGYGRSTMPGMNYGSMGGYRPMYGTAQPRMSYGMPAGVGLPRDTTSGGPGSGLMYAGGSNNFDESTGQYRNPGIVPRENTRGMMGSGGYYGGFFGPSGWYAPRESTQGRMGYPGIFGPYGLPRDTTSGMVPNQVSQQSQAQPMSPSQTPSATYANNASFSSFLAQHPELRGQAQVDMFKYGSFDPNTGQWSGPEIPAESLGGASNEAGNLYIKNNVLFRGNQSLLGMLHGWNDPNSPGYEDAMKKLRSSGFMVNLPGNGDAMWTPQQPAGVTPNSGTTKPLPIPGTTPVGNNGYTIPQGTVPNNAGPVTGATSLYQNRQRPWWMTY